MKILDGCVSTRYLFCFIALLTLSACNFNVTPTFYVRDIQDVVADKQPIEIPIFLKLPASDLDSCNSEIGQVLGIIWNYIMNRTLQSCSLDEDNFFALANVEFSATVVYSQTSQAQAFDGIIGLIVEEGDDGVFYLNLQANPKLPNALNDIENASFFATVDASQVGFVVTLNNDTRRAITLNIYESFVNGIATDYDAFQLGPRSELEIRASDVGANLFLIVVGSASLILNRNVLASHKLRVQSPERKIQDARKTDPRQIGQQKKC